DLHGFSFPEVEEILLRPYKAVAARLRPMDRMVAHTGFLVFARKVVAPEGVEDLQRLTVPQAEPEDEPPSDPQEAAL
ncbi:MAG: tRNA (adenine-N1)-methyltransferase, partial [Anaerolineae bacterium]